MQSPTLRHQSHASRMPPDPEMTLQWKWELGLSQALWPWYKTILAHIYMAALSRNTEIRSCISVPKAALSLFLMPAVDLLDCRRAPQQVKGPDNVLVFLQNKFIMLSLSKFNWWFLNIPTTLLTIVKAASALHSCNVLIRPGCLPKRYFNPTYKGFNCSLCLFTRKSEYLVMMIPSNLILEIQCNVYVEIKSTEALPK